jgi:hypothetical protein
LAPLACGLVGSELFCELDKLFSVSAASQPDTPPANPPIINETTTTADIGVLRFGFSLEGTV